MATVSGDKTVKLWDFGKAVATATYSEHTGVVWSCEFNHTGQQLVTGSDDHTAKVWDVDKYQKIKPAKNAKSRFEGILQV